MNKNDSPFPVIVPFKKTEAHLYCGENPEEVLLRLPSQSVHLIITGGTVYGGTHRLLHPSGRLSVCSGTDFVWKYELGCCPTCLTPVTEDAYDLLTGMSVTKDPCSCPVAPAIPCTVLDLAMFDGTNAIEVLQAGLRYIGVDSRVGILGDVCRNIEEARDEHGTV